MGDQSTPPTFKLVLVGDGGTGKVRSIQNRVYPGFTPSRGALPTSLRSSSKSSAFDIILDRLIALLPKQSLHPPLLPSLAPPSCQQRWKISAQRSPHRRNAIANVTNPIDHFRQAPLDW
jgi:hypothetical protein